VCQEHARHALLWLAYCYSPCSLHHLVGSGAFFVEFHATLIGQEQLTGDYTAVHGSTQVRGNFTLLRQ
jgi:hypothetical protein